MELLQKIKKIINKKEKLVELEKDLEQLKLNTLKKDLEQLKLNTLKKDLEKFKLNTLDDKKININHNNIEPVEAQIEGSFLPYNYNYYEVYHWRKEKEKEEFANSYDTEECVECMPCVFIVGGIIIMSIIGGILMIITRIIK